MVHVGLLRINRHQQLLLFDSVVLVQEQQRFLALPFLLLHRITGYGLVRDEMAELTRAVKHQNKQTTVWQGALFRVLYNNFS